MQVMWMVRLPWGWYSAQLQWLPGLSHVPISDDPRLVASLMLRFLKIATENSEHGRRLPAQRRTRSASFTVVGLLQQHRWPLNGSRP
jgi:hypothetical protein